VFSNALCTDPPEEDTDIVASLEVTSSSVTVFDGGDGSESAWSTALATIDVLVFPEGCNFEQAALFSGAAQAWIKSWIEGGKTVVGTGSYRHAAFVSYMTGLNYSTEFGNNTSLSNEVANPWELQIASATLPATVPNGNYTGGLRNYSTWTADKRAFVTPVYYSAGEDNLAVAYFTFGSGYYIYNAYDWYPDSDELTNGVRAAWDATLQFAASGQVAPPTTGTTTAGTSGPSLAATGTDVFLPIVLGGLTLMTGILLVGSRRRKTV
jgi:LPXTG-motif cell wall-anchored protein